MEFFHKIIILIPDNYYTNYTNIWKHDTLEPYLLIQFENNNHFNFLQINSDNTINNDNSISNSEKKTININ